MNLAEGIGAVRKLRSFQRVPVSVGLAGWNASEQISAIRLHFSKNGSASAGPAEARRACRQHGCSGDNADRAFWLRIHGSADDRKTDAGAGDLALSLAHRLQQHHGASRKGTRRTSVDYMIVDLGVPDFALTLTSNHRPKLGSRPSTWPEAAGH